MKIWIEKQSGLAASLSPYRVMSERGELTWVNRFLDAQRVRGIREFSLRQYGYWLVHFLRWWAASGVDVARLEPGHFRESTLVDYVRAQREQTPALAARGINQRTMMLRRLYQFHFHEPMPHAPAVVRPPGWSPISLGTRRRHPAVDLRVRVPPRIIEPLAREQVQRFWASFRSARDLALIGLLLLNGLRSSEVLGLELEDLLLSEAQVRVRGKGGKVRLLPLAPETVRLLQCYLQAERPLTNNACVFVSLKGPARGRPMTTAGWRSLFRYHRVKTGVRQANPHRFRHTFGSDMIRAGVSLPALQRLMGHSNIETTLLYIQLSPQDVFEEYARAVARVTAPARVAEP